MNEPVLQVLQTGLGASIQDAGRTGWRRFGVPVGGAMDEHAALWANRLVGNPPGTPVLEMLLQGARIAALRDTWIAVTGAEASSTVTTWHPVRIVAGDVISFPQNRSGTWIYLGIAGGIAAGRILGSASAYPRGGLGRTLAVGDLIMRAGQPTFRLPPGVAGQTAPALERRSYDAPPAFRVWPGPQFGQFSEEDRRRFFAQPWRISNRSDRVGYRLEGQPLESRLPQLISEPVRLGTIQVPEKGCPIVTLRDGPTVGGYAKLGVVEPSELSWLAQCRPGHEVRFRLVHET